MNGLIKKIMSFKGKLNLEIKSIKMAMKNVIVQEPIHYQNCKSQYITTFLEISPARGSDYRKCRLRLYLELPQFLDILLP